MELKKILCAVDLKDSVNPAVEYAKMLSELSGASMAKGAVEQITEVYA